jgi:hypothetical protein
VRRINRKASASSLGSPHADVTASTATPSFVQKGIVLATLAELAVFINESIGSQRPSEGPMP